ncbi:hypothetical protein J2W48_002654 [Flavobacterium piscis]|uniref:Uncharacterized protein n=1 Tax=Flavobacterium piscis TaxID=1114874 RepID=A0ABU1Y8Z0_9FLAO|nr:hypothetical protein [Flavobacterium piscis]
MMSCLEVLRFSQGADLYLSYNLTPKTPDEKGMSCSAV